MLYALVTESAAARGSSLRLSKNCHLLVIPS
jgi:hypothetical protein